MNLPVMSIDPSLRNTGIALGTYNDATGLHITDLRLIQTEKTTSKRVRKNSDDLEAARLILTTITRLMAEHQPAAILVEVPSGTQSARASWTLGIIVGLIAALPQPLIELTPTEVKKRFAGHKAASKEQMIQLATERHPELPWLRRGGKLLAKNEHLADAVAVMHAGVQATAFREVVNLAARFAA